MGIKSLNPFLKEKCPEAFRDLPYSYFKGKRIAVDSDNVLRKLMARSHKEIVNQTDVCVDEPDRKKINERWIYHLKEEVFKFLKYGATLIFIFDGEYIDEKSDTQLKRRAEKAKRVQEVEDMKAKISEIDELERTSEMVTELRKKMHHLGQIKPEEKEYVINLLRSVGFPVIFATQEGEKLCAMLCIEGKVDAVYSRDTDVVAMGSPLSFSEEAGWVYNPKTGRTELALKCVFFKPILSKLDLEYESFLDLCIMSGCDFNSNIPRLGVNTAYKLLKVHKCIENLPSKYDDKKDILNFVRCREIFSKQNTKDICRSEVILDIDVTKVKTNKDEIVKHEIGYWLEDIIPLMENLPKPSNFFVEKAPSLSSSLVKLKIIGGEEHVVKNEIPQQKASPPRMTANIVSALSRKQLENCREKYGKKEENEEKLEKKIITLKIIK